MIYCGILVGVLKKVIHIFKKKIAMNTVLRLVCECVSKVSIA